MFQLPATGTPSEELHQTAQCWRKKQQQVERRGIELVKLMGPTGDGQINASSESVTHSSPVEGHLASVDADGSMAASATTQPASPHNPSIINEDVQICQLAHVQTRSRTLIKLQGMLFGQPVLCLVDSGASGNFARNSLLKTHPIQHQTLAEQHNIRLADGSCHAATSVVPRAALCIATYSDEVDLVCLPLAGFDVILGMPWLERVNPRIDWKTKQLTFDHQQQRHVLAPDSSMCLQTAVEVKRAIRRDQVEEVFVVRCDALQVADAEHICDNISSSSESSPGERACEQHRAEVLRNYRSVFPADLPVGLPPQREVDHRIEVTTGSTPPSRATYRMSPVELTNSRSSSTRWCARDLSNRVNRHTEHQCCL